MGREIDLVRYRNDGDDFHILWTARRVLRVLDRKNDLVAVAVEGISERERDQELEPGLLVIDTAEYYGAEQLSKARQVAYYQLKYSTTSPEAPWTASGLEKTLAGFAQRFLALCEQLGEDDVASRFRFRFVSNRPIANDVRHAIEATIAGTPVRNFTEQIRATRTALLKATQLKAVQFGRFCRQLDLWGGQESRESQARALGIETGRYTVFLDADATRRMKDLVREKTLSKSAHDKTININTVLQQLGLGNERELLPCEPKFEQISNAITRVQTAPLAESVMKSTWPVIIRAAGGVGKSVFAQQLPIYLPHSSEAVIFDGFAGGDYRNPRLHRHKHSHGLVHIANELAIRGLCDVLIPQHGASEQEYLRAFRGRIEQAAVAIRARASAAVLLIVIDAADNLGMAAEDVHERSFVVDLLQEEAPEACRIVALARTHRVDRYLKPNEAVVQLDLEPFTLAESTEHLRKRFPDASDLDAERFHRFTDRNPRVQATALAIAGTLGALRAGLGAKIETVEELIAGQLDECLKKVIRQQASSTSEIRMLGVALAALVPPIPIKVLEIATKLSGDAVRSFASDFGNGRPIVVSDEALQFRDEPIETWFHEKFKASQEDYRSLANQLIDEGESDSYIAAALPRLLHLAGKYEELMELALRGAELRIEDPVEKREILLHRVQYALKASLGLHRLGDATKLLLRAGEEVAANARQSQFLMDNADLIARLAGGRVVSDFVFRRRAWRDSATGYVYCSLMLAADRRSAVEAGRLLSLAWNWLRGWFAEQRKKAGDVFELQRIRLEIEDIAAYAEAILTLHGPEAVVKFLENWRDWATFDAVRLLVRRLLDRRENSAIETLLVAAQRRLAAQLAIVLEANKASRVPTASYMEEVVEGLLAPSALDPKEYPEQSGVWLAIAAVAEGAVRRKVARRRVLALMSRYPVPHEHTYESYDRGSHREALLRLGALKAVLESKAFTHEDVTPRSLAEVGEDQRTDHREEKRFKDVYGALIPWYEIRARSIAGQIHDWSQTVGEAQRRCGPGHWSWGSSPDLLMALNEIGGIWIEAAGWGGKAAGGVAGQIGRWLDDQRVMISIPTWTNLARLAAQQGEGSRDLALQYARRARQLIEGEHGDAGQTANSFAALARAVLPLGVDEAAGYFQLGLDHLNRLGDELHERLFCVLSLANKAWRNDHAEPREAYRLARVGELFNAYNNHKFPWHDVVESVARLCPASGVAIASRWNDRGRVPLDTSLPIVAEQLLERRLIRPGVAIALHAFGGYWNLREHGDLFFVGELTGETKQTVFDILVRDAEFDPDTGVRNKTLLSLAKKHGLKCDRLERVADLETRMPESRSGQWSEQNPRTSGYAEPQWSEVLQDMEFYTAESVDEAVNRRLKIGGPSNPVDFLSYMRQATAPARRVEHVWALGRSRELGASLALDGLEECSKDWGDSVAIEKAIAAAVREMASERALDLVERGWGIRDTIRRCAALSRSDAQNVIRWLMLGLGDSVEDIAAGTLFNLAGALAHAGLENAQAMDALIYALDRLEAVMKPEDGDGPWRTELSPQCDVSQAIAACLYAALASPTSDMRWRAAHAARRVCAFGETECISRLVELLAAESLPAFTDSRLPFYALHARLYLLIGFARAAQESADVLAAHVSQFLSWALQGIPHVLIRHFAAQAALELNKQFEGLLDSATVNRLTLVNRSPFPPRDDDETMSNEDLQESDAERDAFLFDYDFDRYWLEPLADTFNVASREVEARTRRWIVDRWGRGGMSAWNKDPRALAGILSDDSHASHGSYPTTDRYAFYLSYHAMLCTAGQLIAEYPAVRRFGEDGWQSWLRRHLLVRNDGRWLTDRRDEAPIEVRRWQLRSHDWNKQQEWKYEILPADFDEALGITDSHAKSLHVWGRWVSRSSSRKEKIRVASALVTPTASLALLSALQTARNPHNYRVPPERDELEIRSGLFQFVGWITDPDREYGLDRFDPFSGDIDWPGARPGRRVRRLFRLNRDDEGRNWFLNGKIVIEVRIWGEFRERRHRDTANHGERVTVDLPFLKAVLQRLDKDLIIDVELERENEHDKTETTVDYADRQYRRTYLLSRNGWLRTLYGCRLLREEDS